MPTIKEYIIKCCEKFSNKPAFTVKENGVNRDISYAELSESVTRLSNGLSEFSGEKIIVSGKNSYLWALSALGVLCSDAVLVPVDSALPDTEFERIASRSNAALIIYSDEISEKAHKVSTAKKVAMSSISELMTDNTSSDKVQNPDELKILMFTSGTTSESKAVMLSSTNILANIDAMMKSHKFYTTDVNLALLPYYHAFGLTAMLLFLGYGIRSVYAKGLRIRAALSEYNVSVFVGVPLILDKIKQAVNTAIDKSGKRGLFNMMAKLSGLFLKFGIDLRGIIFSSIRKQIAALRLVISGAAPLSEDTIKFFDTIGITLIQGYGMTEASPVITAEREDDRRIGSVGKPLPGVDVLIDSPNEDGIGEILARGANIMLGYMDMAEQPFKNGYLKTGDLGYIDKDGFLFICGRSKNVLVLKNGKNVYPEEIEGLISSVPGITESVAHLTADGKYVAVTAVYDPEITNEETAKSAVSAIGDSLSDYKKFRNVRLTTEPFPKTSTGKIKRNAISFN